jgi:hypothetical protein
MGTTTRKATFNLPDTLLMALGEAVSKGAAPSKNAFVERALTRELREAKRAERRARWDAAARDPLLLRDMAEVDTDFASADAETARRIV